MGRGRGGCGSCGGGGGGGGGGGEEAGAGGRLCACVWLVNAWGKKVNTFHKSLKSSFFGLRLLVSSFVFLRLGESSLSVEIGQERRAAKRELSSSTSCCRLEEEKQERA